MSSPHIIQNTCLLNNKKKLYSLRVVDILLDHITSVNDRNTKVINFQNVSEVQISVARRIHRFPTSLAINSLHLLSYICKFEQRAPEKIFEEKGKAGKDSYGYFF